ncbi:MAG: hypothetical protein ABSC18_14280 [Verrucomicrobiota bacterium]|jgi:hypothetical protein
MKKVAILFFCVVWAVLAICSALAYRFVDDFIAPLFLNSRIERLNETGLPKAFAEKGGIYCRMKADDFHLPLPPGSRAMPPMITSGCFDCVDGSVEARFERSHQVTPGEYESWLSSRLQVGGYVTAESVPGGLLIKFHYFGDR